MKKKFSNICSLLGNFTFKRKTLPIIYYHSVLNNFGNNYESIEMNKFKQQMLWINKHYKTLLFSDLNNVDIYDKRQILICFDDGYKDNLLNIFEFMKENNIKYNIFLIGSKINSDRYLDEKDINYMYKSKYVDFGAHTYSHIDSTTINDNNKEVELYKNNKIIEEIIGKKIYDFCFPFGYYNNKIVQYLYNNTEYIRLYSSDYAPINKYNEKYLIGRIPISNDDSIHIFKAKVKGKFDFLYKLHYKKKQ